MANLNSPIIFKTKHRATFREQDLYGHVNTSHYLTYFLDHRFIGCREFANLDLKETMNLPIFFVTKETTLKFMRPINGDEEFTIESNISEVAEKYCLVECRMYKDDGKTLAATCLFNFVSLDKTTQRTIPWPAGILERFFH